MDFHWTVTGVAKSTGPAALLAIAAAGAIVAAGNMNKIRGEPGALERLRNRQCGEASRRTRIVSWMLKWFVLTLLLMVGFSYYDMYRFTRAGIDGVAYRDFAALRQIQS